VQRKNTGDDHPPRAVLLTRLEAWRTAQMDMNKSVAHRRRARADGAVVPNGAIQRRPCVPKPGRASRSAGHASIAQDGRPPRQAAPLTTCLRDDERREGREGSGKGVRSASQSCFLLEQQVVIFAMRAETYPTSGQTAKRTATHGFISELAGSPAQAANTS